MTKTTLACRVLPDAIGRRRVAYLAGWDIAGTVPRWSYDAHRPDVLRGTEADASRWREELRNQGIEAQIVREG